MLNSQTSWDNSVFEIHVHVFIFSGPEDSDIDNDEDTDVKGQEMIVSSDSTEDEEFDIETQRKKRPLKRRKMRDGNTAVVQVTTDPDVDNIIINKPTDAIEDIPVFKNEDDKRQFEANLSIDLSCVDHLFIETRIEQELNDKVPILSRINSTVLSLYTCTVCNKIFKTVSHMRLHCLIHTDLKPFMCNKCNYSTNSKGKPHSHSSIMVYATFNNISVVWWQTVFLVEETGVHGENHRPVASH
jgi:hypothetical protein